MKSNTIFIFPLFLTLACNSQEIAPTKNNVSSSSKAPAKTVGTTHSSANAQKGVAPSKFQEGRDYLRFERIRQHDNTGFDQPAEAFSILLPAGWQHEGEIIWRQPGAGCDGTNQRFRASSADGKYSFEMLPAVLWSWSEDPQMQQINQSHGPVGFCSYGQPMNAEQYLRSAFAPGELGEPDIISVKPNPDVVQSMREGNEKARQELMRYGAADVQFNPSAINANVRWRDGREGIVLCGVSIIQTVIPNQYNGTYTRQYTTQAFQRVVFKYPAGETEQATKMLSVIMSSFRTNPSWKDAVNNFWKNVREQKQIVHIGKIRLMDEQTRAMGEAAVRAGEARLKNMDMEMRSWEQKQRAEDRMHTNFIKTIREVEHYRDETGKIELTSGYNHAWSRSDGSSFLMTNDPNLDPGSIFLDQRWKEMQKVD